MKVDNMEKLISIHDTHTGIDENIKDVANAKMISIHDTHTGIDQHE